MIIKGLLASSALPACVVGSWAITEPCFNTCSKVVFPAESNPRNSTLASFMKRPAIMQYINVIATGLLVVQCSQIARKLDKNGRLKVQ